MMTTNSLTREELEIAVKINSAQLLGYDAYARALFETHFGKRRLANDHHHEYRQRDEVAAPVRSCQQCGELLTDIDEPELCGHCIVVKMEEEA